MGEYSGEGLGGETFRNAGKLQALLAALILYHCLLAIIIIGELLHS